MITILVTDRHLQVVGDPIARWTQVRAQRRFNEPGPGSLTVPALPEVMAQLEAGNRIVLIHNGRVFSSGPYESSDWRWTADGAAADPGQVTIQWADDLALVVARLAYPTPSQPANGSQAAYWQVSNTNAEVAMRSLVNANAGPGALPARQIPHLVLGPLAGVGVNVTYKARWEPLGDVLRALAIAGGGLGFRTEQTSAGIEFQVYAPQDLTGSVRFSRGLGNLREVAYLRSAPTVTAAIVGGQGDLDLRSMVERVNTAAETAWWRVEKFVDHRQGATGAELAQAGDQALAEGAETARLSTITIDTPDQQYGVHYGLGDLVTVVPLPGVEVAEVVRAVTLDATPTSGEQVTALIGSQAASSDPLWLQHMRRLERRLGQIEAHVTTAVTT